MQFEDIVNGGCSRSFNGFNVDYVVFGRRTAVDGEFNAVIDLADFDDIDGVSIEGDGTSEPFSIANAGDFKGDGVDDIANPTTFFADGEAVTVQLTVTNTSDEVQTNVVVTEPRLDTVCIIDSLRPGVHAICTAIYTISDADIVDGEVVLVPSVKSDQSPLPTGARVVLSGHSSLRVVTHATPGIIGAADDQLTVDLLVENISDEPQTNVTISDPLLGEPLCVFDLWSSFEATCTGLYFVSDADILAGNVTFRAIITSDQLQQPLTSTLVVNASTPSESLVVTLQSIPAVFSDAGEE